MIIIWGSKTTTKEYGIVQESEYCPSCQSHMYPRLLKLTRWFSLFWIPLIPYSNKYYTCCSYCGATNEINSSRGKELAQQTQHMQ